MDPKVGVAEVIKGQLNERLGELEKKLDADLMSFSGPILFGMDERVRDAVEGITPKRNRLVIILDTGGGIVEVVERMVDTLRHHYADVRFIIPDRAMSAGTVFALSGDDILMDYFSVLGPIDPQIEKEGKLLPALAYLVQFDRLKQRSAAGALTTAEMVLLQKLDLGELQLFEEARELSVSLLKKWLVKYKFKDWSETETRKATVDMAYKEKRAEDIATALSDHQKWHSHGKGISMAELQNDQLKLKVTDFGKDDELRKLIRSYFDLLKEFMVLQSTPAFVHSSGYF